MNGSDIQRKLKLGEYRYLGSRYYDYPDGQDLLGKLEFTTKISGFVGILVGVVYSNIPPAPKTIGGQFFRIMKVTVPMVGVAATFTFVTYFSTVLRKKDDELNYLLGSVAAGSLLSPILGKGYGIIGSVIFSAFGVMKKSAQLEGKTLIVPVKRKGFSSYYERKLDTSLTPEKKGNWTKELPAN